MRSANTNPSPTATRPPRADARRNRQRILEAAARCFATEGSDATLNGIAREAGVGIGTLFRHFASREELVEASYDNALEILCSAAPGLAGSRPPVEALREWFRLFLVYVTTKHGMAETLRAMVADELDTQLNSLGRMTDAVRAILDSGISAGVFRSDIAAGDVLAGVSGITLIAGRPDQYELAITLIDLLLDGLTVSRDSALR